MPAGPSWPSDPPPVGAEAAEAGREALGVATATHRYARAGGLTWHLVEAGAHGAEVALMLHGGRRSPLRRARHERADRQVRPHAAVRVRPPRLAPPAARPVRLAGGGRGLRRRGQHRAGSLRAEPDRQLPAGRRLRGAHDEGVQLREGAAASFESAGCEREDRMNGLLGAMTMPVLFLQGALDAGQSP